MTSHPGLGSAAWRLLALALTTLFAAALLWLAGFQAYQHAARSPAPDPPRADGIVVLTGGAGRIEAGLRLLADGKAPRLLVSGVGGGDLPEALRRQTTPDPISPDHTNIDRISVGRTAIDTVGNAAEVATWARQTGLHTLIVVTAGYHMARALREITRDSPDLVLYPAPVHSPALRGPDRIGSLRLMTNEYDKFLAAYYGLNRVFRDPHPQ